MLHTLWLWFIVINIFLFLWSRKGFFNFWKKVFSFRGTGNVLKGLFSIPFKIIGWLLKLVWKILKRVLWAIPRFIYWIGWTIVEFFKFLIHSFRALFSLMKF